MSVVPSGAANPDSGLLFQNPVILKLLSPGSFSSGKRGSKRVQLTWLTEEEVAFRVNLGNVKKPLPWSGPNAEIRSSGLTGLAPLHGASRLAGSSFVECHGPCIKDSSG